MKQYEIMKNAGLDEVEINGRKCLIKENIDLDYTDEDGVSNREWIARGLAPLDRKTGKPIKFLMQSLTGRNLFPLQLVKGLR